MIDVKWVNDISPLHAWPSDTTHRLAWSISGSLSRFLTRPIDPLLLRCTSGLDYGREPCAQMDRMVSAIRSSMSCPFEML
jgi:hypothetical protein